MYLCVREGGMERKIRETKQRKRVKTEGGNEMTQRGKRTWTQREDRDKKRGQKD